MLGYDFFWQHGWRLFTSRRRSDGRWSMAISNPATGRRAYELGDSEEECFARLACRVLGVTESDGTGAVEGLRVAAREFAHVIRKLLPNEFEGL